MTKTHSYSKRDVLDRCLRQYFYGQYASHKRSPFDPVRKELLRRLKGLTGLYLLAGDRLHWLIEMQLKNPGYSRAWLTRTCLDGFDKAILYSREPDRHAHLAASKYPPPVLVGFDYQNPAAEEQAVRAREALVRAVDHFYDHPAVSAVWRELTGGEHWVERPVNGLPKVAGYGVEGKVDLAGRAGGRIRIVDWKLGGGPPTGRTASRC